MKVVFRILKKVVLFTILIFSIFLVYINLKLYEENFTRTEKIEDIKGQLNFLSDELKKKNLGKRMQKIFPEGFVFTNALYGLSWCELGLNDTSIATKKQALEEALFAFHQINSKEASSIFDATLNPENGIFYLGWNNYLLSKIILLDSNFQQYPTYKHMYVSQCEKIVQALIKSHSPFLESYQRQCWPADMIVAMASIRNHDRIYQPKYQQLIADWILQIQTKLDPNTKLVPHKVHAGSGKTIEGARGSSISLILRLMAEIDLPFAQKQFKLYQDKFVTTTFGLPSIREYPKGETGFGDIDSGPVIFGVGFAGTIVSIGTFSVLGDNAFSENQYKTINAFGMGMKSSSSKKYVFGKLPIADAFISWGRSSSLINKESTLHPNKYWRLKFHMFSMLTLIAIWSLYYSGTIITKIKKATSRAQ